MQSSRQNKKVVLAAATYFKSLYFRTVLETVKKGVSGMKQKKWTLYWIVYIRINLGTKFQLKLIVLIYWTKFTQK